MKKFLFLTLVLLMVLALGQVCFADTQLDSGTAKGQYGANNVWFIARNGRQTTISADRVVIWDVTSNDGITVKTTTKSHDALVAGVTMDSIPGVTSDSLTKDLSNPNWGRVQVYGRHTNVSFDIGSVDGSAGTMVSSHSTAGAATCFKDISADTNLSNTSRDSFGVTLEDMAAGNTTMDIFIRRI